MRTVWKGHYLDGNTAERREAGITLSPEVMTISAGGLSLVWPYKDVTQTGGFYDNEPVRLEKSGAVLVVRDAEFLKAIRGIAPAHARGFHNPEKRKHRRVWIPAAAVAAVATAAVLYFWAIPAAASYMAGKIPQEWEAELGKRSFSSLTTGLAECEDTVLNQHVDAMVGRLASVGLPYKIRVHVIKGGLVNAFALPGGEIVLFTGLVELTDTPEELAGVLAHEIEHVVKRHSTQGIIEGFSTAMIFRFITGQAGGVVKNLGDLRYSRIHEQEADTAGVELMAASGVDPAGLAGFFEKIAGGQTRLPDQVGYLSSHPMAAERIRYIEEKIAALNAETKPLLPGVDWEKARSACSEAPGPEDTEG